MAIKFTKKLPKSKSVELGKEIIAKSNLNVTSADDLDDAAQKIVKAVKGSSG